MATLSGAQVGQYRLDEELGRGGMATVYRASQPALGRVVAVKVLPRALARDPAFLARFRREAATIAKLMHPNILPVYDFGEQDGVFFIVMGYVPGGTLHDRLAGSLDVATAARIIGQVGAALAYAHRSGVVHRDVKPSNILIGDGDWALLADFGIARLLAERSDITQAGAGIGTPTYMSPEQLPGGTVDARTDVYALGIVLEELLGRCAVQDGERPTRAALERIAARAHAKRPDDRFQSATEFTAAVDAALAGRSPREPLPSAAGPPSVAAAPSPSAAGFRPLFGGPTADASPRSAAGVAAPGAPAAPRFTRSPRLTPTIPRGEVTLPPPPSPPTPPSLSLVSTLLPGVFAVAFLVVTLFTAASGNPLVAAMSVGFMGVSSLTSIVGYVAQRRRHTARRVDRQQRYSLLLAGQREHLGALREQQHGALRQIDPAPEECLARARRGDRRLWERSPDDGDFLALRLGLGEVPFSVSVKAPAHESALDPDPLVLDAQRVAADLQLVGDAPVVLPLRAAVAGVAGPRAAVLNTARCLAIQLATHHAPDEVKIAAVFPPQEAAHWQWLRWLPHTWSDDHQQRYLACDQIGARRLMGTLHELLQRRQQQRPDDGKEQRPPLPHFVVFLADAPLVDGEPALPLLFSRQTALGASCVVLGSRVEVLPRACQEIVEFAAQHAQIIHAATNGEARAFVADEAAPEQGESFARALAPLRLPASSGGGDLPAAAPLLQVLGAARVEALDIAARWREAEPFASLAVPIGLTAGGDLLRLNLHERGHGPHGLIAGATRSGKSELLQMFIAALAATFHPHEAAIVLVDYKGGSTARDFAALPHLIGTITNLEGGLAARALVALRAELKRREALQAAAGVNHIDSYLRLYRRGAAREPMPHLVVIVDEFAELKAEQPEFMKELVSAVRVGGSLGIHLILATQKPSGVVDDQIWANSRFRICLRVERPEDSKEVLRRPDAAFLTQPGRAFFQVGHDDVFQPFQAGFGGAPYTPDRDDGQGIAFVDLDGSRRPVGAVEPPATTAPQSQLRALVEHLRAAACAQGVAPLPGPWLPPLPAAVELVDVRPDVGWDGQRWRPAATWLEPVVGMLDDPAHQRQGSLALNLGKDGHLAIFGAPGSGKTTLLQTLLLSLALTHAPDDVHLYVLDCGGRALLALAALPHVGAVILLDEVERLGRLFRFLGRELERRKAALGQAGVMTLAAYRRSTGERLPAIVVAVDSLSSFAAAYPDWDDTLAQVAREGGNLGVHLVLTTGAPSTLKMKLANNITMAIALQLADRGDFSQVVGRGLALAPGAPVGRGLLKGAPPLEFQAAAPAVGQDEAERARALRAMVERLDAAWAGPRPRPITVLPAEVPLTALLGQGDAAADATAVPIGLDVQELEPATVDLNAGPHFLIAGPRASGKSTLLQTWLLALAHRLPPAQLKIAVVDLRHGKLRALEGLPHIVAWVDDDERLADLLPRVAETVRARPAPPGGQPATVFVLAIDDFDALGEAAQAGTRDRLEQLIRRERGPGFHVLLAGGTADFGWNGGGVAKAMQEAQTGVLLGSSEHSDLELFKLRLPPGEAGKTLPPGQGYVVRRGQFRQLKAAMAGAGEESAATLTAAIAARWAVKEGEQP